MLPNASLVNSTVCSGGQEAKDGIAAVDLLVSLACSLGSMSCALQRVGGPEDGRSLKVSLLPIQIMRRDWPEGRRIGSLRRHFERYRLIEGSLARLGRERGGLRGVWGRCESKLGSRRRRDGKSSGGDWLVAM